MAAVGSAPAVPPPPPAPAKPDLEPVCAQCGGLATERCAGCRSVHYCGRVCQRAAWPEHKVRCKSMMTTLFGGKQLASERDFVLEFWAKLLPASCDVEALLPPDKPFDAAAAFEHCRAAAMDDVMPGYSRLSERERDATLDEEMQQLAAAGSGGVNFGVNLATHCIGILCPAALGKLLVAGVVKPGDVTSGGDSLLNVAFTIVTHPYTQASVALPHALASLRVLLAHARPSDWLVGPVGKPLPLHSAACIPDPIAAQAVLDVIVESPGGFPAHAVAASPVILHQALQSSTASFVAALLAAGADPAAAINVMGIDTAPPIRPLHALAIGNSKNDARDFGDKLRLLLDAGADLEATDSASWTALLSAASEGRIVAFDALLAAGARTSSLRDNIGRDAARFMTVLHQLAGQNNAALIPRVLATGVLDVDVRAGPANERWTPLHWAAMHDAPLAVSALLAGGASLTATDARGMNALQVAIGVSSAKAARPLVEATPRAARPRYAREAALARARAATTAAAGKLTAAQQIAALLA